VGGKMKEESNINHSETLEVDIIIRLELAPEIEYSPIHEK